MFSIERATGGDFERIYPQLRQCFGDSFAKDDWRKIFVSQWKTPEEFCGYMLLNDGEVKGYLGLLFSSRVINNEVEKFCNMTSWCVSDECRGQSLRMMLEALRLKDYTFTNFTASPTVAEISRRLGFIELEVPQQVIFPLPGFRITGRGCACEFDLEKIRDCLNENDRILFDDHQHYNCEHLLLRSSRGYCYVVLKKTVRKHLPFAKVHYLSDAEIFAECVESLMAKICLRLKVFGVMVDERYLNGHTLSKSVRFPHQRKAYYKSSSASLESTQIDTLYSEIVVLHN
jgi:hypothetical protein